MAGHLNTAQTSYQHTACTTSIFHNNQEITDQNSFIWNLQHCLQTCQCVLLIVHVNFYFEGLRLDLDLCPKEFDLEPIDVDPALPRTRGLILCPNQRLANMPGMISAALPWSRGQRFNIFIYHNIDIILVRSKLFGVIIIMICMYVYNIVTFNFIDQNQCISLKCVHCTLHLYCTIHS